MGRLSQDKDNLQPITPVAGVRWDSEVFGYDLNQWITIAGAPVVVGAAVNFNAAQGVYRASMDRGRITFKINNSVPVAANRAWGLRASPTQAIGGVAYFVVTGAGILRCVTSNTAGDLTTTTVPYLVGYNNTFIDFTINYVPGKVQFFAAGRLLATHTNPLNATGNDTIVPSDALWPMIQESHGDNLYCESIVWHDVGTYQDATLKGSAGGVGPLTNVRIQDGDGIALTDVLTDASLAPARPNMLSIGGVVRLTEDSYGDGRSCKPHMDSMGNLNVTLKKPLAEIFTLPDLSSGGAGNAKSAPGRLYSVSCHNTNAAARYIQLFNSVAVPVNGNIPVYSILVPPSGQVLIGTDVFSPYGLPFQIGISYAFSSTENVCTLAAAGDQTTFLIFE